MRPVDRGPAPGVYVRYEDAVGDLVERLGRYCSYCERRLPTNLAVEHIAPKSLHGERELDWCNFLLGCVNCNSVKGTEDVADDDVFWPDRHNTMLAIEYSSGGFVRIAKELGDELSRRARGLVDLVGLDRHFAEGWPRPSPRDRRWEQREEAWAAAAKCRSYFETLGESDAALRLVLEAAKYCGFFSVWMTVFHEFSAVKRALIEEFPGTARTCFEHAGNAIKRPCSAI